MSDDERERGLSLKACLERLSRPCMHGFLRAARLPNKAGYQLPKCIQKRLDLGRKAKHQMEQQATVEAVQVSVQPEAPAETRQEDEKDHGMKEEDKKREEDKEEEDKKKDEDKKEDVWAKAESVRFVPRSFQWNDLVEGKNVLPSSSTPAPTINDAVKRERAEEFLLAYLERVCEQKFRTSYETIKSEFEASQSGQKTGQPENARSYFDRRLMDAETAAKYAVLDQPLKPHGGVHE